MCLGGGCVQGWMMCVQGGVCSGRGDGVQGGIVCVQGGVMVFKEG